MYVVIQNKSKKKVFRKTKRLITSIIPLVDKRLNIGDIPERILFQLIDDLKRMSSRGMNVKIFIYNKQNSFKFDLIEIGKKEKYLNLFKNN